MDTSPPSPPPYGSLIELARKGVRLSIQAAADLAGVSKATWIDNVRGYRKRGGRWEPVDPKPETIAHMAGAARLTPERLETEGARPDAAEILREILRGATAGAGEAPEPEDNPPDLPSGSLEADLEAVLTMFVEVTGDEAMKWMLLQEDGNNRLTPLAQRVGMIRGYLERITGRAGPLARRRNLLRNGTNG